MAVTGVLCWAAPLCYRTNGERVELEDPARGDASASHPIRPGLMYINVQRTQAPGICVKWASRRSAKVPAHSPQRLWQVSSDTTNKHLYTAMKATQQTTPMGRPNFYCNPMETMAMSTLNSRHGTWCGGMMTPPQSSKFTVPSSSFQGKKQRIERLLTMLLQVIPIAPGALHLAWIASHRTATRKPRRLLFDCRGPLRAMADALLSDGRLSRHRRERENRTLAMHGSSMSHIATCRRITSSQSRRRKLVSMFRPFYFSFRETKNETENGI